MSSSYRQKRRAFEATKRRIYKNAGHSQLYELHKLIWPSACRLQVPLSQRELAVEDFILKNYDPSFLYHGGLRGREVGDLLLPGTVTGLAPQRWTDPDWRRCRVYATAFYEKAKGYASGVDGVVYLVKLNGEVGVDPGDVRVVDFLLNSPRFRADARKSGEDDLRAAVLKGMQCSLTGESAEVLQVLDLDPDSEVQA